MLDTTQSFIPTDVWLAALYGLGLLLIGAGLGFFISHYLRKNDQSRVEEEAGERAARRLAEEERTQRLALLEEKDTWYKTKSEQERELEGQQKEFIRQDRELSGRDRDLIGRRDDLRRESDRLKNLERGFGSREKALGESEAELDRFRETYRQRLELAANLTAEEAKDQLLEQLSADVKARSAAIIRAERTKAREECEREARKIIAQAIQRCAVDEAEQISTSTVALPSENLKSRIIGREGRNVRAFETATGVKVVVDDTPDTVLLSSFDPVKRELAAIAMTRLVKDGGFTPSRIDEVVADARKELDRDMAQAGEQALDDIRAEGRHPDLAMTVGRLKYRSSYGQNQLQHCLEVAHLSGLMAAEIGLPVPLARRAGLLHDIGKTVSRELEGTHIDLGVELAEKFDEHPVVKEVIAEHHEENERLDPICFLVKAADVISSIRPGGRREDLEGYARRIMKLEEIANSFEGVKDVYAINAGREMRVMVRGDRVSDDDAEILAFDIAARVKSEITFAGEVKVMVVRETRSIRHTGKSSNRRPNQRNNNRGNNRQQRRNSSRRGRPTGANR
jgi:ribonuclease Y